MSSSYNVIKFLITQPVNSSTLNFSVPNPLLTPNKFLLLDLVENELSNVNKIKITIPINSYVINILIKVTLIEKIEDSAKEFKTKISFYDHHNNKIQELDRPYNKYVYGDSIFIAYDHNQRWNYITGSNLLLYKELVDLGAIDPSIQNKIVTDLTKSVLVDKLTSYLDTGLPLNSDDSSQMPNKIVTREGFPIDLYKYLDVNIGEEMSDGLDTGNKLETVESIDYLNRVIKIMQYYPEFFAAVSNQLTNQNELNTISIPLDSITTLTYPVNVKKSQYIGDIIIQNNVQPNSFSPVEEVLLTPNSTIRYLGSDIEIYPNNTLFRLKQTNTIDGTLRLVSPNATTFILPSVGNSITFYIYALSDSGPDVPLSNVSSIFMIDCDNNIVGGTTTNITTEESSITFPYSALIGTTKSPYTLCIIYGNKIYFNGSKNNGSVGIYISTGESIQPSPAFPPFPELGAEPPYYNEFPSSNSLLYSIQNYEGTNSPPVQYNVQNIILDQTNNKSVTFTINPPIETTISDIFVGKFSNEDSSYQILNISSFDLVNNSITIYYDLVSIENLDSFGMNIFIYTNQIYVEGGDGGDGGDGGEGGDNKIWYYLSMQIYINATKYIPVPNSSTPSRYPYNPSEPSIVNNCYLYQLSSPLAPPVDQINFYHPVNINTIVLFNLETSCHTLPPQFNLSTYSFELGFLIDEPNEFEGSGITSVFYQLNANLMSNSTPDLVMMRLYEYNDTGETDPTLSFSSVNPGTYSVILGYNYKICIAIRYPSETSGQIYYKSSNALQFIFVTDDIDSIASYPPLLSLIEYGGDIAGINFPVDGSLYTGINPYPVTQGDTINIYVYSPINFFESIIYINGYELAYYTKETEATNTYFGGSKCYRSPELLNAPIVVNNLQYNYYLKISIRMTILPQKYYISSFTKYKNSRGVYNYDYSINNIYLKVMQQNDLLIQGNLINGYIVPPNINTDSTGYNDIGIYSTVNGHILLPPKSLYYYETVNLNILYKGYFYVITGNTIANNVDGMAVINGESQHGVFCFEGQGYGKLINTITPSSYNSIINNMLLYFKRIANLYGYGEVSRLIEVLNTKIDLLEKNITTIIYNIELTTRNIYICGKYTTNIYINGNALPVGISYYPNQVTWQGNTGTIPTIPTSPNPDVNGNTSSSGLDKYYIQYSSNGIITEPTPLIGEYWGLYSECTDLVQLPNNWTISNPFVLPENTKLEKFKGSNSFTTINEIITDDPTNYQINFSTKNCIIIPSDYVGYGIINSPTAPSYILTIYLNGNIGTPEDSDTCDCDKPQIQLNGSTIFNGTEITIINNSSINVRVISLNLASQPPTPIQINLQDTTTDALFISPTDNIHLIFGGNTWSII